MALISTNNLTMVDLAKRYDPSGSIPDIVELLAQHNPVVDHAIGITGNLPTGHRFVVRDQQPTVGLRAFNEGALRSKSKTRQIDESCSLINVFSDIDCDLAELNGDVNRTRWSEDQAFIQAMNEKFVDLLFHGNPGDDPKEFLGLANRYNTDGTASAYEENTIKTEGTITTGTSFWFVTWDSNCTFLITPKGSAAGLQMIDHGKQAAYDNITNTDTEDASTGVYYVYRSEFKWMTGLGVKDPRQNVRIQFDLDSFSAFDSTDATNILHALIDGYQRIYNKNVGRTVAYCSREMYSYLWKAAIEKVGGSTLSREAHIEGGRPVLSIFNVPVFELDGLGNAEASVS